MKRAVIYICFKQETRVLEENRDQNKFRFHKFVSVHIEYINPHA